MDLITQPFFWLLVVSVALGMEFWAWALHRVLWHGPLWPTHRTHHIEHDQLFEFNDLHGLLHAALAGWLLYVGLSTDPGLVRTVSAGVGVGMTTFGLGYWLVHDGFIHERLPLRFLARMRYFRHVRAAHRAHHLGADVAPFGLFLGYWELRRARR